MKSNFERSLAVTLAHEGGWADHRSDPGGATMRGVTLATYRRFKPGATKADLRQIPMKDVETIYRTGYWDPVGGDRLATGVDLVTFDAGVNSGPARARRWLMASIGGPDHETARKLCARRLGFMRSLAIWKTFGKGWSRRVADVEAKGVAWALTASMGPAAARDRLKKEADAALKTSRTQAAGAGASGATSTAGGADSIVSASGADEIAGWTLTMIFAVGLVLAAILVVRSIIHRQRADAYQAEIQEIGS